MPALIQNPNVCIPPQTLATGPTGGSVTGPTGAASTVTGPTGAASTVPGPQGSPGTSFTGPTGPTAGPSSPTGSVQFNNNGVFGGSANLVWNGNTLVVTQVGVGNPAITVISAGFSTSPMINIGGILLINSLGGSISGELSMSGVTGPYISGAGNVNLGSTKVVSFSQSANVFDVQDAGVGRNAALGCIEVNNGTPGSKRDLTLRTIVATALPTSAAGLNPGDFWVDTTGGFNIVKVV